MKQFLLQCIDNSILQKYIINNINKLQKNIKPSKTYEK